MFVNHFSTQYARRHDIDASFTASTAPASFRRQITGLEEVHTDMCYFYQSCAKRGTHYRLVDLTHVNSCLHDEFTKTKKKSLRDET